MHCALHVQRCERAAEYPLEERSVPTRMYGFTHETRNDAGTFSDATSKRYKAGQYAGAQPHMHRHPRLHSKIEVRSRHTFELKHKIALSQQVDSQLRAARMPANRALHESVGFAAILADRDVPA